MRTKDGLAPSTPPGVPRALASHPVLEADDLEQVQAAVSDIINPHSMRARQFARLSTRLYAASVGAVTMTYVRYGAEVEIAALDVATCYCVQFPLAGTANIECGTETLKASPKVASVPSPVDPLRMVWSNEAAHLVVRVGADDVHQHLEALLGRPRAEPLRLGLGLRLTGAARARWGSLIDMLHAEIAWRDAPHPHGLARASASAVEELVLNALLLWQPNNYREQICARSKPAAAPYVRRAIEFAQDNLGEPLTVRRLADVAGVSVRALQEGFRRELGCSPARYVRDERLARVRAELIAGEPPDTQVTAVALRWGFSHLGRFASVYRTHYGELPSSTLAGAAVRRRLAPSNSLPSASYKKFG